MSIVAAYAVPHPPLIIPEIGKNEIRKIQKTVDSYQEVARRIRLQNPETIIVSTPHSIMYSNYNHISPGKNAKGDFGRFGCPQVELSVAYDDELASLIELIAEQEGIMAGKSGERDKSLDHGTLVPLYFLKDILPNVKIVRISLSGLPLLDHYRLGQAIQQATERLSRKTVFIASGDLSHKLTTTGPYGFSPEGPIFDDQIVKILWEANFGSLFRLNDRLTEKAAECGLRSLVMMAGSLDKKAVIPELISYEGPFGVGYAVAAFNITGDDPNRSFGDSESCRLNDEIALIREKEDDYVRLARASLEYYVANNRHMEKPEGLNPELSNRRGGVFVSLKVAGNLRGCIGTISAATESLADEIIQNAVSAGSRDPRFDPVRAVELGKIIYSVDVLNPAERIKTIADLDPKRYGVIVRHKGRSGLLLPDLEGVDSPEEQIRIALQKGHISPEDDYEIERFEVIRHH